jgi:hypothetical protein
VRTSNHGLVLWLAAGVTAASSATFAFGPAEEGFRKLKGPEIRKTFLGKIFTDEAHFSERYKADGTIQGYALGKAVSSTWKIVEDELCITSHADEICYAVWKKESDIQLVFKDADNPVYGKIK